MTIDTMGQLNAGWGICGFTSSLYALYHHNAAQQARLAQAGNIPTRMVAEIKTYLRMLQADGSTQRLAEIEQFTQSFGGVHAAFTIDSYIAKIDDVVDNGADPRDATFGIALPPDAVVDYLQRVCNFPNAKVVDLGANANELILGVYDTNDITAMYNGLQHYVYSLDGTIYSWGDQFTDVQDAMGASWDVCYKIAF